MQLSQLQYPTTYRHHGSGLGFTALLSLGTLGVLTTLITLNLWLDVRREQSAYFESRGQQVSSLVQEFDKTFSNPLQRGDIRLVVQEAREIAQRYNIDYVQVYDKSGTLLVDTRQEGQPAGDISTVKLDWDQSESIFTTPINTGQGIIGIARVSLSTTTLDNSIQRIIAQHSRQGLIAAPIALLLALLCARYVTQPVRYLARAAQRLGDGENITSRSVERSDEIGELARVLQDMDLQLARNRKELQSANEELETRVRDRTADLAASNEKLALEIAEREALQGQVIQYQKMESVGRLAGGIAHDLNNLLTPIIGFTQLSLAQQEGRQKRENLEQVYRAATRASNLIKQLLAFSRPSFVKREVIHLNDLVADTGTMLRRLIGEDIELVLLLGPDVKPINADPSQIEQILLNLTVNARDASLSGGKIVIQTSSIPDVSGSGDIGQGERVVLAVSDNGCGMTVEVKSHIFEPFFTTKENGKGTGLGLATCYGIVEQLGGKIDVQSEVGQGTAVRVYLPTVHADLGGSDEKDPFYDATNGSGTVLLVEDEPLVRSLVSTILKEQGYSVLEATNGEEALRLAEQYTDTDIRLLLTDVVMPQMVGTELAKKFRSRYPKTGILLMSGYNDEIVCENEEYGFIPKPFTPADLSQKVREVLSQFNGVASPDAVSLRPIH